MQRLPSNKQGEQGTRFVVLQSRVFLPVRKAAHTFWMNGRSRKEACDVVWQKWDFLRWGYLFCRGAKDCSGFHL
jgi:hypothetical protein